MKIKSIEPIAISLPMLKPVIMAGEEVTRADNVLVRVTTDDGLVGWGEAASAPVMTGDTLESLVAAVHYLEPVLRGRDPADIAGAHVAMDGRMYGNHGAKAAIEIALYDLAGKAANKPVHALLGVKKRSRMPLLAVVGGGDFDGDLQDAAKKKAAGFTAYKIKVGIDSAAKDEAIAYARAVGGCGLDFFEQPVMADNLAGMAAVAAVDPVIAVGADEGIHSLDDIRRHHERHAARGVSLKAIKLGGIGAVVEAGQLCGDLGMSVNISCKTGESSVACAAALHVAAVIPNIAWGLTLTHTSLGADVTAHPVPTASGHADALDRPGLGIDVDEDRVRRHRVQFATRDVAACR